MSNIFKNYPLYSQDGKKDPLVILEVFIPNQNMYWLLTEGNKEDDDFTFFGYCKIQCGELGYVSFKELSNLNYELELTKNMALVFENENALTKDSFPNNKRISAIVLIVLTKLYELIKENKIILNEYEIGKISYEDLYNIIIGIKNKYNIYLSKTLKDLTDSAFFDNIIDILETYTFIRNVDNYYEILPAIRIFSSKLIENKNKQLDIWGDNND